MILIKDARPLNQIKKWTVSEKDELDKKLSSMKKSRGKSTVPRSDLLDFLNKEICKKFDTCFFDKGGFLFNPIKEMSREERRFDASILFVRVIAEMMVDFCCMPKAAFKRLMSKFEENEEKIKDFLFEALIEHVICRQIPLLSAISPTNMEGDFAMTPWEILHGYSYRTTHRDYLSEAIDEIWIAGDSSNILYKGNKCQMNY